MSTGPSSSSPSAKRRTFVAIRSASSGPAISGVLPTCGVMMQFGSDHRRMAVGQRLRDR